MTLLSHKEINILHIACDDTEITDFGTIENFVSTLNNKQSKYYLVNSQIVFPYTRVYLTNKEEGINYQRAKELNLKIYTPLEFAKIILRG